MKLRRTEVAIAVVALSFLFHRWYGYDGIALFDEGLFADGAVRVLAGGHLGRDVFVPYGPGGSWVVAPLLAAFGANMAVLRTVMLAIEALCAGGLFLVAAETMAPLGALLATGFLIVAHGSFHKCFLVLAALLVLLGARALARRAGLRGAFVAGLFAGVAFLFRHDAGVFGAIALAVALFVTPSFEGEPVRVDPLRRVVSLAVGFLTPVVPAALVLLGGGLDPVSWWDHEWQRIAVQERIRIDFPWPMAAGGWRSGRAILAGALIAAPCLHLAWGGAALWRRWRGRPLKDDALRVAAALFGLLLLNQARLIPSVNHLFQSTAPLALALGDVLARRERGRPRVGHATLALLLAALVGWCATMEGGPYSGSFAQKIRGAVPLAIPAGGVNLEPSEAAALTRLVEAIDRRVPPDGSIVTSAGCPLVGFLARRALALPYAEPAYYYREERFQREAIDALERRRPALFVHDPRPAATFTLEREAPLLALYLAQHYRPVETIDRFTLFERAR
jgi:hypothetical protein